MLLPARGGVCGGIIGPIRLNTVPFSSSIIWIIRAHIPAFSGEQCPSNGSRAITATSCLQPCGSPRSPSGRFQRLRQGRGGFAFVKWTIFLLALIAGGALAASVPVSAFLLVCIVTSGLLVAMEIGSSALDRGPASARAEAEAMEALLHTEQKLHLHIEQTRMGVMELDLEGRLIEWNTAAERIFGYSRDEVIGKDFRTLIVPEASRKDVEAVGRRCSRAPPDQGHMSENVTRDGRIILCEWSNAPIRDTHGQDHRRFIPVRGHHREAPRRPGDREPRRLPALQSQPGDAILRGRRTRLFQRIRGGDGPLARQAEGPGDSARGRGARRARVPGERRQSRSSARRRSTPARSPGPSSRFPPSAASIATPRTSRSGSTSSSNSGNRKKCNPSANSPPAWRTISTTS